jgi:hypothetical protein
LAVITPSLAWLLWAVPACGLIGVGLLLAGVTLVIVALRRYPPSVS